MRQILFVSSDNYLKHVFESAFDSFPDIRIKHSDSSQHANSLMSDHTYDVVIADETLADVTGFSFIRDLVCVNPMVHCAIVSSLSEKEFHEQSEGLGLLMQIPVRPGKQDAEMLLEQLAKIEHISEPVN